MATAHATCPECLGPVESDGVACPQCGTTYHAACRTARGCVVAGCSGAPRPAAPSSADAPAPLQHRVLAAAPDALFAIWLVLCVLAGLTGNAFNAAGVCDPALAAAALAGVVVYPARAARPRNAPVRLGLAAAFLLCVAAVLLLSLSGESRYGRAEPPEPLRILRQLMSSRAERSAWDSAGRRFYAHGLTIFYASMSFVGLALLVAAIGVARDRPRTRAALAMVAALAVAAIVALAC